ncbi:MAG: hypothetical protein QW430_12145 [Metallosphaera sp.]|uniref:hypothetical protein n=1 Tax=Metallosphaera sp. TaxID=2020860 RepID=UPI003166EAEB
MIAKSSGSSPPFSTFNDSAPPYSTTTYILLLILAPIVTLLLYYLFSTMIPQFLKVNNELATVLSNVTNNTVNEYTVGNVTVEYLNGSYNNAISPLAVTVAFFSYLLTSPYTIAILFGIALIFYALFSIRRKG